MRQWWNTTELFPEKVFPDKVISSPEASNSAKSSSRAKLNRIVSLTTKEKSIANDPLQKFLSDIDWSIEEEIDWNHV